MNNFKQFMLNNKIIFFLLLGLFTITMIIVIVIFIKFNNDNIAQLEKINQVKNIEQRDKELIAKIKKIENQLMEDKYKNNALKSGITKEMESWDLVNTSKYVDKDFFSIFNKPFLVDFDKTRIISINDIKGKNTAYYVSINFVLNNFFVPYYWEDEKAGKIKVFLEDDKGKKTYINGTDERLYAGSIAEYKSFNSNINITINALNKNDLLNLLKEHSFIGIEGNHLYTFHNSDYNFNFKLKYSLLNF